MSCEGVGILYEGRGAVCLKVGRTIREKVEPPPKTDV